MQRRGSTKRPFYAVVAADSRSPRDGRFLEKLGTYDPCVAKEQRVTLKADRVSYWLGVGATPSKRVEGFLKELDMKSAQPEHT
jgi:small subunit ribosomal protein S16